MIVRRVWAGRRKAVRTRVMATISKPRSMRTETILLSLLFAFSASTAFCPAEEKPASKTEVLDPNNYVGQVKAGYAAAREIPEICAKLFCYCGCDLTDCHGSLLDCFTSDHGVDCHICQEESILALKFHRKGKSLSDIQKFIDKRYAKEYPFEVESPILQKYKRERLWDAAKKSIPAASSKVDNLNSNQARASAGKRRADGSCCEGSENKKQN